MRPALSGNLLTLLNVRSRMTACSHAMVMATVRAISVGKMYSGAAAIYGPTTSRRTPILDAPRREHARSFSDSIDTTYQCCEHSTRSTRRKSGITFCSDSNALGFRRQLIQGASRGSHCCRRGDAIGCAMAVTNCTDAANSGTFCDSSQSAPFAPRSARWTKTQSSTLLVSIAVFRNFEKPASSG